jgi:tetratricopeptide (TPR) repeat protein
LLEEETSRDKGFFCEYTLTKAAFTRRNGDLRVAADLAGTAVRLAFSIGDAQSEASSLRELARVLMAQGDYRGARLRIGQHSEIMERTPLRLEQAEGQVLLARIEEAEGNVRAAIDAATAGFQFAWCDGPPFCYSRAIKKCSEILERLGAPLPVLPHPDPALTEPWPVSEIDPPEAPPRRVLHDYALRADTGWLSPLEAEVYLDEGRLAEAFRDRDYVAAIELADRLLARDDSNFDLLERRAEALWYAGQYERAEADYTRLVETPGGVNFLAARGQVRAEMGKTQAALDDLKDFESQPYALNGMGLALGQMGRHAEAFQAFQASIELAPENAWVYYNRARIHELEHNTKAALEDYRRSLTCAAPPLPPFKRLIALQKVR